MEYFQDIANWLWVVAILPLTLLARRLLRTYMKGFEDEAGTSLQTAGKLTAQLLVNATHRLLTVGFKARYYRRIIQDFRDYQVHGLRTPGPYVLDLDKVFVQLRVAPESPGTITSDMLKHINNKDAFCIWDLLDSDAAVYHFMAVIGPPGSGKTTLLRHLTLAYAAYKHRMYDAHAPYMIPLLLVLRDYSQRVVNSPQLMLADILQEYYSLQGLKPPPQWFRSRMVKGRCLVLLDGLDEIGDTAARKAVSTWIDQQMQTYFRSRFIVTSRPFGYLDAPIRRVRTVLDVQPFSSAQIGYFIDNWYLQNSIMRRLGRIDDGVRRLAAVKATDLKNRIHRHDALQSLAKNPLLLAMIALVHDNRGALPGRRVELYAEICDVMLGRRAEAKGLVLILSPLQKQRVLQVLALALMVYKTRTFSLALGIDCITERLTRVAGQQATCDDFLRNIERLSGLLVEREAGEYEFAHKSFQEYLASVEIKEEGLEAVLIDNLHDQWWEETIRLFCVQAVHPARFMEAMLNDKSVRVLALAYDCLEDGAELVPEHRDALEDRVDKALASNDLHRAATAARVKLTQRLKRLEHVREDIRIDINFVTSAEYQLFLDSSHPGLDPFQPDHWPNRRFSDDIAAGPVLGVRPSDAQRFCKWLNVEFPDEDFFFRLPSPEEAAYLAGMRGGYGCWCEHNGRFSLSIDATLHQLLDAQFADAHKCLIEGGSKLSARLVGIDRADELMRLTQGFHRELEQAQNILENPDYVYSVDRLPRYDDDLSSFHMLPEVARVFARARDRDKALEWARGIEKSGRLERVVSVVSHLRRMLERDLNRDASLDLDMAFRAANYLMAAVATAHWHRNLWEQLPIEDIVNLIFLIEGRRTRGFPAWEGIRIVKQRKRDSEVKVSRRLGASASRRISLP